VIVLLLIEFHHLLWKDYELQEENIILVLEDKCFLSDDVLVKLGYLMFANC
jgi:hypothetical protein